MKRTIQPAPPVWTAPVVPAAGALLLAGILVGTAGGDRSGVAPSGEMILLLATLPVLPIGVCLLVRLVWDSVVRRRRARSPRPSSTGEPRRAGDSRWNTWQSLLLSLAIALPLAGLLAAETARASRPPTAALTPRTIVGISGRSREDLRPSSDVIRVLPVSVDRVETREGWAGSAGGTVRLLWRGDTSITDGERTRRVVPIRGDRIDVAVGEIAADEAGSGTLGRLPPVLWVENEDLTCHPRTSRMSLLRRRARDVLRRRLARFPAQSGAFVTALLLGDRAEMDAEVVAAVRRAGASHVIALSGMHLGVLAVILGAVLRRVASRSITHVIVAFVLIGYVWIVGWIPSLLRALVLLILLTVGEILDRGTVAEISLARCTVVVAVVSPTLLSEAGFILSILALIGLFTLAPVVAEALGLIVPGPAAGWLAAPVGALAATAPFSLLTFGSVYPVGILSAGVLAPLVVAIMWGSMLYLVVATVPYLGTALIAVIDGGVRLLLALCRLFALVPGIGPGSGAGVAQTAGWCTLLAAIGLVVGILRSRRHRRVASALEMYDQPQLDF